MAEHEHHWRPRQDLYEDFHPENANDDVIIIASLSQRLTADQWRKLFHHKVAQRAPTPTEHRKKLSNLGGVQPEQIPNLKLIQPEFVIFLLSRQNKNFKLG